MSVQEHIALSFLLMGLLTLFAVTSKCHQNRNCSEVNRSCASKCSTVQLVHLTMTTSVLRAAKLHYLISSSHKSFTASYSLLWQQIFFMFWWRFCGNFSHMNNVSLTLSQSVELIYWNFQDRSGHWSTIKLFSCSLNHLEKI